MEQKIGVRKRGRSGDSAQLEGTHTSGLLLVMREYGLSVARSQLFQGS